MGETEFCQNQASVEKNISDVSRSKEERSCELVRVMEQCNARLESQLKTKLLLLLCMSHSCPGISHLSPARKAQLGEEIELLESMYHELNRQLSSCSKSSLIQRSADLIQMITVRASQCPLNSLLKPRREHLLYRTASHSVDLLTDTNIG